MLHQQYWLNLEKDIIQPTLLSMYWFPLKYKMEFKILLVIYKASDDQAPVYLKQLKES